MFMKIRIVLYTIFTMYEFTEKHFYWMGETSRFN